VLYVPEANTTQVIRYDFQNATRYAYDTQRANTAVQVNSRDEIFISDGVSISKHFSNWTEIARFGSLGSGDEQFDGIRDISDVICYVRLIFAGFFATFLTFQGLWATPYLMSVFGLERLPASELNMLVPLGFIIGAPLFGRLTDRLFHNRIHVLILMLILESAIWTGLTYGWGFLGIRGMIPTLFLMGAFSAAFATAFWALVRETTPKPIMGSISGLLNPAPFMGVAILQVVTGAILRTCCTRSCSGTTRCLNGPVRVNGKIACSRSNTAACRVTSM